jgi:hypothetical protein
VDTVQTSRYNRPILPEEQQLYDHLLYWIDLESPSELIERFRSLFITGVGYPDPAIAQAVKQVISASTATEDFRYVLNRCCHILINRWRGHTQAQMAIPQLIQLFEISPTASLSSAYSPSVTYSSTAYSPTVRRLHHLRQQFTETEQYLTLRRLSQVLTEASESVGNHALGGLMRRYPYLYEHCLLNEASTREQKETIQEIQVARQRQFELNLSQYITYQLRRSHAVQPTSPSLVLHPVKNPTFLTERELGQALKYYAGKVDGNRTHKDLALNLLTHTHAVSFGSFKDDLYQYITATVDPSYGKRKFNSQLYRYLQNILPEGDTQQLNDFLLIRTCNHLLNFLIADKPQAPNHFVFIDLLTNLGPIVTIGILLRIVLLCRKVKPCLERRLSILFNHYEMQTCKTVEWLVQALETLNVALTTNFGAINLSFMR